MPEFAGHSPDRDTPVGITSHAFQKAVNNDYFYPRHTRPPLFDRGSRQFHFTGAGPYRSQGLVRGWIYPMWKHARLVSNLINNVSPEDIAAQTNDDSTQARDAEDVDQEEPHVPIGVQAVTDARQRTVPREIRYQEGKQFQFNPESLDLAIELVETVPDESLAEGGTAQVTMVGNASTKLTMLFDRSIEVNAASAGITMVDGIKIDPIFADIGVQKDIWDVFRIILGGDEDYLGEIGAAQGNLELFGNLQAGGVTDMTTRLFDLGQSSQKAFGRPVAVYYNPNFVIFGVVTGLGITYAEFNANYVPTKAAMAVSIQVFSTTTESGIDMMNASETITETTGTGGATPDAGASTNNQSVIVPVGSTGTAFRVAGTNIRLEV